MASGADPESGLQTRRRVDEPRSPRDSIAHTVRLLIVAFAMAFVFRGFVIEPFVIPTGSMAPTLLGAHVLARSPFNGAAWAIGPRDYAADGETPLSVQAGPRSPDGPLLVHDPHARLPVALDNAPLRAGDRILVQKYIYAVSEPRRWDVVVFRGPEGPDENLIKRLVGLPGEELRLVAGDVFTSRPWSDDAAERASTIRRKPRELQAALWRPIHDSAFAPTRWTSEGRPWTGPWQGPEWTEKGGVYETGSSGVAMLRWTPGEDPASGEPVWPLDDFEPYNETPRLTSSVKRFPVGDLRVRMAVEPVGGELGGVSFYLDVNGRTIKADIGMSDASIEIRSQGEDFQNTIEASADLSASVAPLPAGRPTNVEFWHWDQTVALFVEGRCVLEKTYELDADERLRASAAVNDPEARFDGAEPLNYARPTLAVSTTGQPARLWRLAVDRDIYYQPSERRRSFVLGKDEFFVLGDNSAASRDARAWSRVDAWVGRASGAGPGIVTRELLMGRAFFVYFPAPFRDVGRLAVPDVGRARFIR